MEYKNRRWSLGKNKWWSFSYVAPNVEIPI